MQITYRNSFWDLLYQNFYQFTWKRGSQLAVLFVLILLHIILIDVWIKLDLPLWVKIFEDFVLSILTLLLMGLISIPIVALQYLVLRKKKIYENQKLTVTPEGLVQETTIAHGQLYWSGIDKIWENSAYIMIYATGIGPLAIPRKAFPDHQSSEDFFSVITEQWTLSKNKSVESQKTI